MPLAAALCILLAATPPPPPPVAPAPYPAAAPPPFDAATRPAPVNPADQIAPHGDPRDSGWKLLGEPGSEAQGGHLPSGVSQEATCRRRRQPVCGANGRTYRSACDALPAGADVRSVGACPRAR